MTFEKPQRASKAELFCSRRQASGTAVASVPTPRSLVGAALALSLLVFSSINYGQTMTISRRESTVAQATSQQQRAWPKTALSDRSKRIFRKPRSTSCAGASSPRSGPKGRPSRTRRKACRSRRCASSRILGDRLRLAQGRSKAGRAAAIHHRDRRAGYSFHPRSFQACECVAARHQPRMARLDHRAAEDHRSARQSHRPRRPRSRRFPRRDSFHAGLRLLRQADEHRLGPRAHGPSLGRADETPRLRQLRRPGRRLGRVRRRPDGPAGTCGIARHPHQHARHRSS